MMGQDPAVRTYSAEAAPGSVSPITRAMHSNPERAAQAYGMVISFAGTPKPVGRILQNWRGTRSG
jgi:hypothetical protein